MSDYSDAIALLTTAGERHEWRRVQMTQTNDLQFYPYGPNSGDMVARYGPRAGCRTITATCSCHGRTVEMEEVVPGQWRIREVQA